MSENNQRGTLGKALIVVALVVAVAAGSATAATPKAAISKAVAPTGNGEAKVATTWNVSLSGINAWQRAGCKSTAYFPYGPRPFGEVTRREEPISVDGKYPASTDPRRNLWSFTAATPVRGTTIYKAVIAFDSHKPGEEFEADVDPGLERRAVERGQLLVVRRVPPTFLPLSSITASCELTRRVYVGLDSNWRSAAQQRSGDETSSRRPNGCKVYSYSVGHVTIDCRRSRSGGSVSWRFGLRPGDRGGTASLTFDRLESTMGAHTLTSRRAGNLVTATETVSAGTMITVKSVTLDAQRLYSKKVWRDEKLTLNAAWPSKGAVGGKALLPNRRSLDRALD